MITTYIETKQGRVDAKNVTQPTDRIFRDAWQLDGGVIDIDMDSAREIWRDKIREARKAAFAPLDDLYREKTEGLIEAQASGEDDTEIITEISKITTKKKLLRAATQDPAIEAAQNVDELKKVQPSGLTVT